MLRVMLTAQPLNHPLYRPLYRPVRGPGPFAIFAIANQPTRH